MLAYHTIPFQAWNNFPTRCPSADPLSVLAEGALLPEPAVTQSAAAEAAEPAPTDVGNQAMDTRSFRANEPERSSPQSEGQTPSPCESSSTNCTGSIEAPRSHVPIKSQLPQQPPTKQTDWANFDAFVYAQEGASSPPPGITLPALPAAATAAATPHQKEDEPLFLGIDPHVHWPRRHSAAWYAAKQDEIRARGRRKENFGRGSPCPDASTHSTRHAPSS